VKQYRSADEALRAWNKAGFFGRRRQFRISGNVGVWKYTKIDARYRVRKKDVIRANKEFLRAKGKK